MPEPGSGAALALIGSDLMAPTLLISEVANALWKAMRRGQFITGAFSEQLKSLPQLVTMVAETPYMPRAFDLAKSLEHPVYDCVYLALAEALGQQLVTADTRFLRKLDAHPALRVLARSLDESGT